MREDAKQAPARGGRRGTVEVQHVRVLRRGRVGREKVSSEAEEKRSKSATGQLYWLTQGATHCCATRKHSTRSKTI